MINNINFSQQNGSYHQSFNDKCSHITVCPGYQIFDNIHNNNLHKKLSFEPNISTLNNSLTNNIQYSELNTIQPCNHKQFNSNSLQDQIEAHYNINDVLRTMTQKYPVTTITLKSTNKNCENRKILKLITSKQCDENLFNYKINEPIKSNLLAANETRNLFDSLNNDCISSAKYRSDRLKLNKRILVSASKHTDDTYKFNPKSVVIDKHKLQVSFQRKNKLKRFNLHQFLTGGIITNDLKNYLNLNKNNDSVDNFPKLTDSDQRVLNHRERYPHVTGIQNTRSDYYTIPSMNDLIMFINKSDNTCLVPHFTVGRLYYGNVFFPGPLNVANLNLDEIIQFNLKEVEIYPEQFGAPPKIGVGLNRPAQITLEQVWPTDKQTNQPIKSLKKLNEMNYIELLKQMCLRNHFEFVEYRPVDGIWIFKIQHI